MAEQGDPAQVLSGLGVGGMRPLAALEESRQAGEGFQAIAAFVDWLRNNGMGIGLRPVLPDARLIPLTDPAEDFAAAFYDIDIEALHADRAEYIYRQQAARGGRL
ncbi:hypothetical protein SEA_REDWATTLEHOG_182 [Gordonia phage RedWattleHog]|uniref:Uncharacterized protein n=1 Tax=Gordonia phage Stormageddon TaxID=2656541 RepID=A0A649VU09_9CAUD|nr:hypothetical protein KHQ86_gp117 [Gordonia phage Stormageddon]QGJ95043.1 hypothetical protein SEA_STORMAGEDDON_183 [Gordonia phage Stormageddon]QLF83685.1 hypothetical protein SEA_REDWATTLEHOG_182 [Gordonia phage RedWattleHog]